MKYALITGASSGMGLHYSLQLAKKGYGIIIVSNRHEENITAAEKVRQDSPDVDVRIIDSDLTLKTSVEEIYQRVKAWNIEVEVLISNAGILLFSMLKNTPLSSLERIIELHCLAPVKLVRLFGEDMASRKRGYILIVSSATAWMPYPTISHYAATKSFLKSYSRSLWYEMRQCGVSVTAVYPGAVDTPLYKLSDKKRRVLRNIGIMLSPEEVVATALKCMFRRKYMCKPGFFNKVSIFLCRIIPPFVFMQILRIPVLKRILENA